MGQPLGESLLFGYQARACHTLARQEREDVVVPGHVAWARLSPPEAWPRRLIHVGEVRPKQPNHVGPPAAPRLPRCPQVATRPREQPRPMRPRWKRTSGSSGGPMAWERNKSHWRRRVFGCARSQAHSTYGKMLNLSSSSSSALSSALAASPGTYSAKSEDMFARSPSLVVLRGLHAGVEDIFR